MEEKKCKVCGHPLRSGIVSNLVENGVPKLLIMYICTNKKCIKVNEVQDQEIVNEIES